MGVMKRIVHFSIAHAAALTAALVAGCDDTPDAAAAVAASGAVAPGLFDSLLARIGGTLVATDDENIFVEVMPEEHGKIYALVIDSDGEVVDGGAGVEVEVKGEDGQMHPVTLQWDAVAGRYVGETDVTIVPGPLSVSVSKQGGSAAVGRLEAVAMAPIPEHGGSVVVAEDYAAEIVPSADGTIHAYVRGPEVGVNAPTAFQVEVSDDAGVQHPVILSWDRGERHYVGRVSADVTVGPGPMGFTVIAEGRPRRSRVRRVVAVGPSHGGDVVLTGDYAVEVVPGGDGRIDAYVVGPEPMDADAEVVVTVGRERQPVTLVWSAEVGHFVGAVDADIRLASAPIGVVVMHGGRRHHGAILHANTVAVRHTWGVRVRPSAEIRLHGHPHGGPPGLRLKPGRMRGHGRIDVHGPAAPHADIRVHGPSGMLRVNGPSGRIRVNGPSGMLRVNGPSGRVRVNGPSGRVRAGGPGGSVRVRAGGGGGGMGGMGRGMR